MSATCSLVDGNVFKIRAVVLDSYCKSASVFTVSDTSQLPVIVGILCVGV